MDPWAPIYRKIAEVCHEANRAYRIAMNEPEKDGYSLLHWDEAPDWQKDSCIAGVRHKAEFPDATPAEMHNNWLIQKQNEGWIYGPEKNPELKTHPCMLEYSDLSQQQKAKDHIFSAIAGTLIKQHYKFLSELGSSLTQLTQTQTTAPMEVILHG